MTDYSYHYLIIGGGMTADSAVKGIRSVDRSGTIGLITDEKHRPYDRPPLSKALWKGDPPEKIWRDSSPKDVSFHLSTTITKLDPDKKFATDKNGKTYAFQKLLLATGGSVRRLRWNVDGVIYFRTFDDYQVLRKTSEKVDSFVVIGGGFIGSEIAAALSMNGKSVTMIFPEEGIGARVYPTGLSSFLNTYYRSKGITIHSGTSVNGIERKGESYLISTDKAGVVPADCVVAGIGIQPNVELAQQAGLKVEDGIIVNEFLQTEKPDIYAAGDVARFYSEALGKRVRVEHEDNANTMGIIAGGNMAGQNAAYRHIPFFYSDLFDLGYEAVGELDSRFKTVEDWKEEYREGVVYYLDGGGVRGVLLWNTWGQVDAARSLITNKDPVNASSLKGRIPAKP